MSGIMMATACCCGGSSGPNALFRWRMPFHWTKKLASPVHVATTCDDIAPDLSHAVAGTWTCLDPAERAGKYPRLYPQAGGTVVDPSFCIGDYLYEERDQYPASGLCGCCIAVSGSTPAIADVVQTPGVWRDVFGTLTYQQFDSVVVAGGLYSVGTVLSAAPWNSNFRDYYIVLDCVLPEGYDNDTDGAYSSGCTVRLWYARPSSGANEFRLALVEYGCIQNTYGTSCTAPNYCGDGTTVTSSCNPYRSIVPPFTDDDNYAAIGSPPLVLPWGTC